MTWGPWSPTTRTRVPTYGKASGGIRITHRPSCGGGTSTCCSPAWRCKARMPRAVPVRGREDALQRTVTAVDRSGLRHAELWSYRIADGKLVPMRYGTSSDVQLWSLTDIAVQYLLNSPRPTQ